MKRLSRLLLLGFLLLWLAPMPAAAQDGPPEVSTIEVAQVDNSRYPEIDVYVRVLDKNGSRVEGLAQENFSVSEDGKPAPITGFSSVNHEPIRTLLLIDKSGSMDYEDKLYGAKTAATTFVDLMRTQDEAALVAFDNGVNLLQSFTTDHGAIRAQIESLQIGDCTSWYEAVYSSADIVRDLPGRKSLILLSDGMDCREDWTLHELQGYGSYHSFEEALDRIAQTGTPVYSIALGREPAETFGAEGYDQGRLTRIAEGTGGQYYHAPTASQLVELYELLSVQTREEYVLTYKSPRPTYDGTRRNIEIGIQFGEDANAGLTVSDTYTEAHLLTLESDWRIAALCLPFLVLGIVLPLSINTWLASRRKSTQMWNDVVIRPDLQAQKPLEQIFSPAASGWNDPAPPPPAASVPGLYCTVCGKQNRAGARFCSACGTPTRGALQGDWLCPICSRPVQQSDRFCPSCGYSASKGSAGI